MKRIWNISLWSLTVIAILVVMGFASHSYWSAPVGEMVVKLDAPPGMQFINEDDVKARITDLGSLVEGESVSRAEIKTFEEAVLKMQEIEEAQVYRTMDKKVVIEAKQRLPIVRIFNQDSTSFYLDEHGFPMPLSSRYTARVLVFTGAINEHPSGLSVQEIVANDSIADAHRLDEIYGLALFIKADPFWKAQIQHVHVSENGEMELIPRVGNHRIMLGRVVDIEEKFENLKLFYTHGLKSNDWNGFDTINLKYRDQIVCTKKS